MSITYYTDGSAKGNGTDKSSGGYGVVEIDENNKSFQTIWRLIASANMSSIYNLPSMYHNYTRKLYYSYNTNNIYTFNSNSF